MIARGVRFSLRRFGLSKWALLGLVWAHLPRKLKLVAIGAAGTAFLLAAVVIAALVIVISKLG